MEKRIVWLINTDYISRLHIKNTMRLFHLRDDTTITYGIIK